MHMTAPGRHKRNCTLCRTIFMIKGPSMLNPADVLCNDCVRSLWASEDADDQIIRRCEPLIPTDFGVDPAVVSRDIAWRVGRLRNIAQTKDELEHILAQRV